MASSQASTGSTRLVALLLCALLVGHAAWAAPKRSDAPQRRVAASEFKRGKALYEEGDYKAALEAFKSGFEYYPLRGFLVNIAHCHRRLGELTQAAAAYQQFLDGPDVPDDLRTEVEEALAEVRTAQRNEEPTTPTPDPTAPRAAPDLEPLRATPVAVVKAAPQKKSRVWLWTLLGVGAAAVVAGVTVGVVLGTRGQDPGPGSLGLFDGRTR